MINSSQDIIRCEKYDSILSKDFWGGVAMCAPFYAEFFSWRWAAILIVPFLFLSVVKREKIKAPCIAVLPMLSLLLLHLVALVFSDTVFASQVIKDLVITSAIFIVYCLVNGDVSFGFFLALTPLALTTAVLGVVKVALLDRGYMLGFIVDSCSVYPAGSALCVNYNNLGLIWLVAMLGCLRLRLWWVMALLITAGVLSSSRRFVVLIGLLPVVWFLFEGRSAIVKGLFVGVFSAVLIYMVSDPASFDRYRFGGEPFRVLEFKLDNQDSNVSGQKPDAKNSLVTAHINRSAPIVMLGTMADGTMGTQSRLTYWELGASMLSWLPQGWSYHKIFSCSFSACSDFHYPHMSIMAEWIVGGVVFGLVAIGFYVWPFLFIWRARRVLPTALFLVTLPYSLISGDTVFSLPICTAGMLVALSSVQKTAWRVS